MIKIKVLVEPSEKVDELQKKVRQLERELTESKRRLNALEFSYINECKCNFELTDLLQAHGINFRQALSRRIRNKYRR